MPANAKYYIFLCFVLALFFVPHWLIGQVYGSFDLANITIPVEDIFSNYQHRGLIPVWVPEIQAGYPLVANAIQSFFYAPHVMLRQLLSGIWVANISLMLHMWLAGIGMFCLLRSLKFDKNISLISALIFAGGGYFIGRITLPHLFFPASWIPLIMWAQIRALLFPKIKNTLLFASIIALQIFSGHIQMFVFTIIIMTIVALVYVVRGQCSPLLNRWHILLVPALVFLLTAVNIIPVVEILPQSKRTGALIDAELLDVSYPPSQILAIMSPSIFGYQASYVGAKNEPELMIYFGWLGLIAGIAGLFAKKTREHPAGLSAIIMVVLGILLAGGNYSPFWHWVINHISFWAQFGNPGRALILMYVGWVLLIAFGLEHLIRVSHNIRAILVSLAFVVTALLYGYANSFPHNAVIGSLLPSLLFLILAIGLLIIPRKLRAFQLTLFIVMVSCELLWWGFGANYTSALHLWNTIPKIVGHLPVDKDSPRTFALDALRPAVATDFNPTIGTKIYKGISVEQTIIPQQDNWQGGAIGLTWNGSPVVATPVIITIMSDDNAIVRSSQISGMDIGDGSEVPFTFEPITDSGGKKYTLQLTSQLPKKTAPSTIMFTNIGGFDYNPTGHLSVCQALECNAVTSPDWNANADLDIQLVYKNDAVNLGRELLGPLTAESLNQDMVRGFLTLQIGRMYRYMYALGEHGDFIASHLITQRGLLDRLSVGGLLSTYTEHRALEGMPNLNLVSQYPLEDKYLRLYKNNQAFPRVAFADEIIPVTSDTDALKLLSSGKISAIQVVVENLLEDNALVHDLASQISILKDTPQSVSISTTSSRDELLVLRDTMYTGWHAYIDDKEAQIYYTDSVFRGVVVPAGHHVVHFRYIPTIFNYSAGVSLVSWVMVISFLAWKFHIERKQGRKLTTNQTNIV